MRFPNFVTALNRAQSKLLKDIRRGVVRRTISPEGPHVIVRVKGEAYEVASIDPGMTWVVISVKSEALKRDEQGKFILAEGA